LSFGLSSGGGQVRYALIVDDQATAKLNTFKNSLVQVGTTTTQTASKMSIMNNAFSAGLTPIKNTGNALNQLTTTHKTLGQQLGGIATGFKNNALAIGAAASSVLGLYQNYSNLSSAQNAANKSATAAKAAQNSVASATKALSNAINKYGQGSKEAKAAQDKLTVAQERAVNKTESAKIAQDNLNQTMADFGINILPNVVLAGGSIVSIFDNIGKSGSGVTGIITKLGSAFGGLGGGGAGITSLTDKFKALGGSILGLDGPMKGFKGNLLGLSGITAVGIVGIIGVMSDLSAKLKDIKDVSSKAITPVKALGNEFDRWQNFDFTTIEGLSSAIVHGIGPGIPIMGQFNKGLKDMTSATIDQTTVAGFLAARQKDVVDAQKNYNDMVGFGTDAQVKAAQADLDRAKKNLELTESFAKTAKGTDSLNTAQQKYNATQKESITLAEKSSSTWALQVKAFEGTTTSINLAAKAYLDVHNTIVQTNPTIAKNIEQARLDKQEHDDLAKALEGVNANAQKGKINFLALSNTYATITKTVGLVGEGIRHMGDDIAFVTAQTDPFNAGLVKLSQNVKKGTDFFELFGDANVLAADAQKEVAAKMAETNKTITPLNAAITEGTTKFSSFVSQAELGAVTNKRYTDSLRQWVSQQIAINPALDLTTSQLESLETALAKGTDDLSGMSDATKILADAMNAELAPAMKTFESAIQADKWKDFKNTLKDLPGFGDFSKKARKDLTGLLGDMRNVGKTAKEVATDISAAVLGAFEGLSGKSLGSFVKELNKDIKDIAKIDIDATKFKPIQDFLDSLTDENRASGILKIKDSLALMQDAMSDGNITAEEAASIMAKFAEETGKTVDPTTKSAAAVKAFGVSSAAARGQIDQVTGAIDVLKSQAEKVKPIIKVDTSPALDSIGELKRGWDKVAGQISKMIPKITVNTDKALDIIGELKRGWDKTAGQIEKKVPKITVNANQALDMIGEVTRGLQKIKDKTVTVTVKSSGSGLRQAQHGMHEVLAEDTIIQAHKGEMVNIGRGGGGSGSGSVGSSGGGSVGDIILNVNVLDETIMRKIERRSGRNRWTLGV